MVKKVWCVLFFATTVFAKPLKHITVALDWFVNPNHAPLFVAQQQGFFKTQGLKVTFIPPADPSTPPSWVATGKVDMALDYQPHYKREVAAGLPLKQVGVLVATPLNCIAVLKDSDIKTVKDLKSRNIGFASGAGHHYTLIAMLHHAGLTKQNVNLINVHYDLSQALLAHKVDAITGLDRNFEAIQLKLAGHPVRLFYPEENGVPPYDGLILVVNTKNAHAAWVKKFLRAATLGVQYLVNHPEKSWQLFASQHVELNNVLNKEAWFATLPRFALRPGVVDRNEALQAR